MQTRPLGRSGISIAPLVLGGNVFGSTVDAAHANGVLDAFLDHGLNAIDTADIYVRGVSETLIGDWMQARGNRDKVILFTKVGYDMGTGKGLSAKWIAEEVEASLMRHALYLLTIVIVVAGSPAPQAQDPAGNVAT